MQPPLELSHHTDLDNYRRAVDAYLRTDLGGLNHLYTTVHNASPDMLLQRQSWLARLHCDGRTCGLALINSSLPLRSLVITDVDAEGARLIAQALAQAGIFPTDVTGPRDSVGALIAAMRPVPYTRLRAELGNHLLDTPPVVPACPGSWRAACVEDRDLLCQWERAFMVECGFPVIGDQIRDIVEQRLASPTTLYRLWEVDGAPAAMAMGKLLPPTARIGPVYTTPAFRGRGCAGSLVAHLGRELMTGGASAVSLFTDLANPVSNGVYRRIGFRLIGELIHFDVESSDPGCTI